MTVDLLHNKIVRDTLTDAFVASVNASLCPLLEERYGESLLGIQMYEDFLADELLKDKRWYYPMTAVLDSGIETVWISWDVSKKDDFAGGVPYAYLGESLEFRVEDDVPMAFISALRGRARYFEGGCVKLNVVCNVPDITMLSGKYSQTFIDELNRQMSDAICRAAGVSGIESSTVELDVVFAPETYMEHTSENVTYRRLLISAKGCMARDFWVKWTRQNSSVAFTIADNVTKDDIVFDIGEDVPHKIREKEYRFLVYGKSEKYRAAMGRKNITEWRELIKRAIKRGELLKDEGEIEINASAAEASDKLSEILAKCGINVPSVSDVGSDDYNETNAALLSVLSVQEAEDGEDTAAEDIPEFDLPDADGLELNVDDITEGTAEETAADTEEEPTEDTEEVTPVPVMGELDIPVDEAPVIEASELEKEPKKEPVEKSGDEESSKLREIMRRLEDENRARMLAEQEARRLRERENDLLRENRRLEEERRRAEEVRVREEAARREQEKLLREQIEREAKEKAREKLLFAEAARLAREEHERVLKEREAAEEQRIREAARKDELRRAEEERVREEERIKNERERIENEARERADDNARRRREIEERAREARARMENEARLGADEYEARFAKILKTTAAVADAVPRVESSDSDKREVPDAPAVQASVAAAPTPVVAPSQSTSAPETVPSQSTAASSAVSNAHPTYTYTSRIARLLFRRNIDPNVNVKIRELISAALAELGKENVYIKVRASIPDNTTVILNFVKIPEEELDLLVDVIKYLGNSDLGIYKVILE